jgi:hypothetical protein
MPAKPPPSGGTRVLRDKEILQARLIEIVWEIEALEVERREKSARLRTLRTGEQPPAPAVSLVQPAPSHTDAPRMIIGRSNTRTVTCPEHMAEIYHAALLMGVASIGDHIPMDEPHVAALMACRTALLELAAGFAPIPEGATSETLASPPGPVPARPAAPSIPLQGEGFRAGYRAATLGKPREGQGDYLAGWDAGDAARLRQVLPAGYTVEQRNHPPEWWVCDAQGGEIMGPHPTREAALDAWSDHESRPAE